jgi:hypothetical protein
MNNDEIQKDVWNKKTTYKFFGITFFEKEELCDNSNYKQDKDKLLISPLRGLK